MAVVDIMSELCDYQSERHCSKTVTVRMILIQLCDYQSERHCSKTRAPITSGGVPCDYQSERHCSKTGVGCAEVHFGAITSQNGTAPKLLGLRHPRVGGAITSQNGTAPKPAGPPRRPRSVRLPVRTALLQNKSPAARALCLVRLPVRTALLQNDKQVRSLAEECDYQSERHCSKTVSLSHKSCNSAITSQNGTAPKRNIFSAGAHSVRLPVRTALLQNRRL